MKKENRKNKLIEFLKLGSESLFSLWVGSAPARFSNDESGLNYWKDDVLSSLMIEDDDRLSQILKGDLSLELVERAGDWSLFSTLFPNGEKIRNLWRKRGEKTYSSFISWLKNSGLKDSNLILSELEKDITPPASKIELPTSTPPDESNVRKKIEYNFSGISDEDFYREILRGIGAPETENNLLYLFAWRQAEGGNATFNPFNTTQKAEGASNYNKVGVKNYTSPEQGLKATIKTLLNGRYGEIISSLKRDADPMETAEALERSPWGTGGLAKKVISGYQAGYSPKPKPIARA
jgi:hypothetical protein